MEVLESVKSAVTIPVAVKLSPYFSSPGEMAMQLDAAGADALVLFNRFMQPGRRCRGPRGGARGRPVETG